MKLLFIIKVNGHNIFTGMNDTRIPNLEYEDILNGREM